jgi:hypothetical protein
VFGELPDFALGAAFNLAVALLVVRGIYYPATRSKDHVFSFLAFNTVIFFVLSLLRSVELSVGVGFGLFAIFSVLNYRTAEMSIREMTYLFTLIALPVMNAFLLAGGASQLPQVLAGNAAVVLLLLALEKEWGFRFESSHRLTYDRLDLLAPAHRDALLDDLRARTGLPVKRVEIGRIDFLKDAADLQVFYDPPRPHPAPAGTATVADAGNAPDARVTFNPNLPLAPSATDTP